MIGAGIYYFLKSPMEVKEGENYPLEDSEKAGEEQSGRNQ